MGLKIPRLFVFCFFWRLRVVFKRFPTNVGVRKHFESRTAVSIARFLRGLDLEGKPGQGWDPEGLVGWEVEEDPKRVCETSPHCLPGALAVGTGGHGAGSGAGGSWAEPGAGSLPWLPVGRALGR